jgi:hypothetical protein
MVCSLIKINKKKTFLITFFVFINFIIGYFTLLLIFTISYILLKTRKINTNYFIIDIAKNESKFLDGILSASQSFYSKWPMFKLPDEMMNICLSKDNKSFSRLNKIINNLLINDNVECQMIYNRIRRIYDISFKKTNITFPENVYKRIQKKLGLKSPFKNPTHDQVCFKFLNIFVAIFIFFLN